MSNYISLLESQIDNPTQWVFAQEAATRKELEAQSNYNGISKIDKNVATYRRAPDARERIIKGNAGGQITVVTYKLVTKASSFKTLAFIPFFILLLAGCSLLGKPRHGELTRRFNKKVILTDQPVQQWVDIKGYAFSVERPAPAKPKTFFDLAPAVQQELVTVFAKRDTTSVALINSMILPLSPSADHAKPFVDDRTTFKKRLVFSVRNKSYSPADRIWKLLITLNKQPGIIRFSNTSALATDFESVDVGNLSFDRKTNFSSELSAGSGFSLNNSGKNTKSSGTGANSETGGDDAKNSNTASNERSNETNNSKSIENNVSGKLSYGADFESKEEVALKQRFVKLSGAVSANSLSLYQESTSGIDLSGNIVADVEFSYQTTAGAVGVINQVVYEFSNLKSAAAYNSPTAIKTIPFFILYPDIADDIYGTISFEAILRQVTAKDNTIAESDDRVTFAEGNFTYPVSQNILLLSRSEVIPEFWRILDAAGRSIRIQSTALGTTDDLVFRSLEDAINFLQWMKNQGAGLIAGAGVISGGQFTILPPGGVVGNFTPALISSLHVSIR